MRSPRIPPLLKEIGKVVLFGVVARILLLPFSRGQLWPFVKEVPADLLIAIVSFGYVFGRKLLRARDILMDVFRMDDHTPAYLRKPFVAYLQRRVIKRGIEAISSARSDSGAEISTVDLDSLAEGFFTHSKSYQGTDSHTPSEFLALYPHFLDSQTKNIAELSVRILLVDEQMLVDDLHRHQLAFEDFLASHSDHSRRLLQVDPSIARECATNLALPSTDIGIWDNNYAVLFCPKDATSTTILIRDQDSAQFEYCKLYFLQLLRQAREIITSTRGSIQFVDRGKDAVRADIDEVSRKWPKKNE
jgi:hypothetical protein